MPESDKTILAVYKSLDDENSGGRGSGVSGSRQQATESTGTREYSLRQQQEAGKIRMLGGGTWVERRSCGWVWQHSSGDYQIEQQREAAKLAGSIASTKNRGHVEARADWLVRGEKLQTESSRWWMKWRWR